MTIFVSGRPMSMIDHESSHKNSVGSKIMEALKSPMRRRKDEQYKQKDNNIPQYHQNH